MRKPVRVLLTGGGSGGHIIPSLAVATAIKNRRADAELLYIAARGRLDSDLLEQTNIPFRQIFAGKLRRYFSWRNFVDPFLVLAGFFQSLFILIRFWPDVVFSKGGYVSLPVTLAAWVLRRPVVLHESDSRMGLANRVASRFASIVCVAFPALLKKGAKYRLTGNPIRPEVAKGSAEEGYRLTGFSRVKPVLLVWGGSQGSAEVNHLISHNFERFTEHFQVVHITGASHSIKKTSPHYIHFEYLGDELKHIYAITDLVIGRAGANSLYELAYLKKPSIMIPLGNSDQMGNARYFEEKGAGIILRKDQNLFDLTLGLWQNQNLQESMKKSLASIAENKADETIAKILLNY